MAPALFVDMFAVARLGDDMQVGALTAGIADDLGVRIAVVQAGDENTRGIKACSLQKLGPQGSPISTLEAEVPQELDRLEVVVDDGRLETELVTMAVDDLAEPPDNGNDDRLLVVYLVGLQDRPPSLRASIMQDEEEAASAASTSVMTRSSVCARSVLMDCCASVKDTRTKPNSPPARGQA